MKVLVIGANGMAGHVITRYLKQQGHKVTTSARSNSNINIDIEKISHNDSFFTMLTDYDFVINCIGLLVKDSIDRPDRAAIINSWFPHYLEYNLKDSSTRLIHLSTDCVFDGKKGEYVENDIHTEMNAYGSSKSNGEVNNSKDITFRMSIIGPEIKTNGTGLFNWISTNPQQELQGWDNAWWNGITTLELAKSIDKYINDPTITGIYHLVSNKNKINKYDLLCKINEVYAFNKTIIRTQGPKPVNKILIDTRNEFNFDIVDYDTMIAEMKKFN
jgi:dTDP-4-dehydrorhamnose reductase